MAICFHNSMSRRLEEFVPLVPGEVRMYHCGPTVYSSPHIGNFRTFLLSDLLRRFFDWKGFKVLQVMNLTDVGHLQNDDTESGEDKMEVAARKLKLDVWQLAQKYTDEFFAATRFLSFRPAHFYPRATDHVAEMIDIIKVLIAKGHAYVVPTGNVYFSIATYKEYGRLSGNTEEELLAGARIEVNPEKKDPRDFALWKVDPRHQMQWDSPWGRGFPGWHIECSAMSRKYLGETLDIHTGGEDNVFPHHECEIAQSECSSSHHPFVRYWLHARHLLVDNKKMAKSTGNFLTVSQLIEKGHSGDALHLALTRAHYREKLNFTLSGLDEAERKIQRYRDLSAELDRSRTKSGSASSDLAGTCSRALGEFGAALCDDLNISVALASLDGLVTDANRERSRLSGVDAGMLKNVLAEMWTVLGLQIRGGSSGGLLPKLQASGTGQMIDQGTGEGVLPGLEASGSGLIDPEICSLIEERDQARARKDWVAADKIRDRLREQGIEILDTKDGLRWRRVRK